MGLSRDEGGEVGDDGSVLLMLDAIVQRALVSTLKYCCAREKFSSA